MDVKFTYDADRKQTYGEGVYLDPGEFRLVCTPWNEGTYRSTQLRVGIPTPGAVGGDLVLSGIRLLWSGSMPLYSSSNFMNLMGPITDFKVVFAEMSQKLRRSTETVKFPAFCVLDPEAKDYNTMYGSSFSDVQYELMFIELKLAYGSMSENTAAVSPFKEENTQITVKVWNNNMLQYSEVEPTLLSLYGLN